MNAKLLALSRHSSSIVCALSCVACLTPAADRAQRDATIGSAESATYAVHVSDGLAAVREANPHQLVLWQSAPAIEVGIDVSKAEPFELHVGNVMPGSKIQLVAGAAAIDPQSSNEKKALAVRIEPSSPGLLTFRVSSDATDASRFRFALMSDVQEAITEVSDVFLTVNRQPNIDFLLGAGDLTQRGERAQLERFERELATLDVPYYTTLGNHELGVEPTIYQELFGRGSFSFVHRGVRFTLLDSASATLDRLTYDWLDEWLLRGAHQFHVVGMHVPPLDPTGVRNGAFASRDEALALIGKLQAHDVDLTVYGHVHSFYDFDTAGIPAVISGGGGAIPERFDNVGRHFVVFEVDPLAQTFTKELVRVD